MGLTGWFTRKRKSREEPGASSESRQIVDMLQNKNAQSPKGDLEQSPQATQGVDSAAPQQGEVAVGEGEQAMNSADAQTAPGGESQEGQQEDASASQSGELVSDDEARDDLLSSFDSEDIQHVLAEESLNSLMAIDIYQLLEECKGVDSELRNRH